MSWLSTSNNIFSNAETREHRKFIIQGFTPLQKIISETGKCFSVLKDEEDDAVKSLKWFLWNLKQAVSFSILPFDYPQLSLHEMVYQLKRMRGCYPTVNDSISIIIEASEYLLDKPQNPKREKVFDLLKECHESNEKHALVSIVSRGRVLGWGDSVYEEIRKVSPNCSVISSKNLLCTDSYGIIITPSGGSSSPILNELMNCSYGRIIEIVAYDRENVFIPARKTLPTSTHNYKAKKTIDTNVEVEDGNHEYESSISDWEKNEYWESFRNRHGLINSSDHGLQYVVKARLIILPDNKIVYLRDDVKIINLTNVIGEDSNYLKGLKKFPRTMVRNLCEGDLIVLRTSGSGEYLLDVANMLMKKNGRGDLREKALEWKIYLTSALETEGSFKIFNLLKEKGHDFSNHLYLWAWTTMDVMGPANDSKFLELIAILDDLGCLPDGINILKYAEDKWALMRELKRFHHQAGLYIRKELLAEMKRVLESGVPIQDQLILNLPGVSSGALSVLRVVGVDPETQTLPYNEVGFIREICI